jgi:hypothetical protein
VQLQTLELALPEIIEVVAGRSRNNIYGADRATKLQEPLSTAQNHLSMEKAWLKYWLSRGRCCDCLETPDSARHPPLVYEETVQAWQKCHGTRNQFGGVRFPSGEPVQKGAFHVRSGLLSFIAASPLLAKLNLAQSFGGRELVEGCKSAGSRSWLEHFLSPGRGIEFLSCG